jgi:hypothetical protein
LARQPTLPRLLPYVLYLAAAVGLLNGLWRDPSGVMLADNYQDHNQFEWFLLHGAQALVSAGDPFFTDKLNAPDGVNLMANTSVLAWALPLAPVTLLAGPPVTFVLVTTLALAGTAAAWYYVLHRLLNHRIAAAVGGAFCGFAPAMISQATGHPNIAAQYLVPFLLLVVIRMREPGSAIRRGLVLAAMVVVQAFINEEVLFLTAMAMGIFVVGYAVARPREVAAYFPGTLKAFGVAAVVAGAILAYPLYRQFFGAQSYHGLPGYIIDGYGTDLGSYWSFARRSIAGSAEAAEPYGQGPTEENTFFGWPLLIAVVAMLVLLRRSPVARALAVTATVFALASLGLRVTIAGMDIGIPGPWALIHHLPLFDSVVPTRLSLVVTPLLGILIALVITRVDALARSRVVRVYAALVLLAVLAPLAPTPLPVSERSTTPAFFSAGTYRDYVRPDGVVLVVPPGWWPGMLAMQWQTEARHRFRIFGGYFLAPDPNDRDGRSMYGPAPRWTIGMLTRLGERGEMVEITDDVRAQAKADFDEIGVDLIVLPADHFRVDDVRAAIEDLVQQPGERVDGVWVWRM